MNAGSELGICLRGTQCKSRKELLGGTRIEKHKITIIIGVFLKFRWGFRWVCGWCFGRKFFYFQKILVKKYIKIHGQMSSTEGSLRGEGSRCSNIDTIVTFLQFELLG